MPHQAFAGQSSPSFDGKKIFVSPDYGDVLVVELLSRRLEDYSEIPYGAPFPANSPQAALFPNHRLTLQVETSAEQVVRYYAADRSAQESYNASIGYSGESRDHPIFTRDYIIRRSDFEALDRLDPLTGITSATVTAGGSGFTDDPVVTFSGGTGTGGAITAVVSNGAVVGLTITAAGNYTVAPTIAITGGTGATGEVTLQSQGAVLVKEDALAKTGDERIDSLYILVRRIYETLPGPWIYQRRLVVAGASDAASTYFETKKRRVLASTYPSYVTNGISDVVDGETSVVAWERIEGFVNGLGASVAAKIYIDRIIDQETDVVLASYHQIVSGDTADSALRGLYDSDAAFGTATITAFNTVASIAILIGGSAATKPTLAIDAPLVPGGTQATATVATMGGITATVAAGGSGYTNGNLLTLVGGTSTTTARFTATVVAGVVTALTLERAGSYSVLPSSPVSVTGGSGSGATLTVLWTVLTVTVTNAGTGYRVTPNVFPSTGTANLRATIGGASSYTVDCYVFEAELEDIEGSAKKILKWQTAPIPAPLVTHIDDGFSVPGLITILSVNSAPGTRPWPGSQFNYAPPLKIRHAARQTLTFKFGSNFNDLPEPFGIIAPASISSFFPISENTSHPSIDWGSFNADGDLTYRETFSGSTSYGQGSPYCLSSTQKRWRGRFRVKRVVEIDPAGVLY